ncbi:MULTISPECIES: FAD-dependent oxidoreductase [unclassified Streptomyces]|uniref:NAD(P)/FAD-dependent oxidoreductase n=1 Tax=unclassified Streptomyces TaxID=2593676 RepID=UPI002E0E4237|nr:MULTISPECIES: FAD-dependent oxidoreductase [unclassified Streptomyces]WSR23005.1 FAD-dependent oxidoreductase [Streptomyces sp. NBC_01205]
MRTQSVAVIGGGVAGLTAAYVLQKACDVTLYEADPRLGGHAHTHELPAPGGGTVQVDSGFIVHNERTYPLLLRLFRELGVATQDSEMSMSVRCDGCGLEYAGARGPAGLFTGRPALRGRYLRLLAEVPLFHRRARRLLAAGTAEQWHTLRGFLADGGFSPYFVTHFVIPLVSAVWSCPADTALEYPAAYLFRFLDHHGLLSVTGSPQWKTVTGGSAAYVGRAAKEISNVRTATPVNRVDRIPGGVLVGTEDGTTDAYDAVVIATHPDQALRLLADPTRDEQRILGTFRYEANSTVLHTDTALLPRSRRARASWNYHLDDCHPGTQGVRVSYDMTRLQQLPGDPGYVVSLNAGDRIDPERVLARMEYAHPVYTPESVAAQRALPRLNTRVTAFAGAYHGWGFHEDGCRSGVRAAAALGVRW